MLKKLLYILTTILLITGCKKDDELDIEAEKVVKESVTEEVVEEDDPKPLITVDKDDVVSILVRSDGYPGMWKGEDGEVYGFYVDLERMIMERMGQKFEFLPYDHVGVGAQALKTGTSHNALAVPDVPDYRAFLNLTIPYETINYITFVREENRDITGSTKEEILESLKGKEVGVQTQGHVYQTLREYKDIILIEYPTTTEAMAGLARGEVDAVPENREIAEYYQELNSWKFKEVGGFIHSFQNTTGFSKVYDTAIVDRYNKALNSLIDDGSISKLHIQYYGDAASDYAP